MISTSFLRTLSLKKYQDFNEENKNRLKVFYMRAATRIKKEMTQHRMKQKSSHSSSFRCPCRYTAHNHTITLTTKKQKSHFFSPPHIRTNQIRFEPNKNFIKHDQRIDKDNNLKRILKLNNRLQKTVREKRDVAKQLIFNHNL